MFAAKRVRLHPCHVAVTLLGNPVVQMRCRVRDRIRMRDADCIEPFFARPRDECGFDRRRIFQKSRSV
jgi:hypothetical protein